MSSYSSIDITLVIIVFQHTSSLLSLTFSSFALSYSFFSADIDVIVNQIVFEEPLISESKKPHLRRLIYSKFHFFMNCIGCRKNERRSNLSKECIDYYYTSAYMPHLFVLFLPFPTELIEKLESNESSDFFLFKILRAHILPLTNCAFNKSGDKFITGRSVGRSVNMVLFRPPFYSWILVLSTVDTHTHTSYDSHTHQRLSCSPFLIPCTLLS